MRSIIIFLTLAGVGIITWLVLARPAKAVDATKQQSLGVSKHSDDFNKAVGNTLDYYNKLSEQFVTWDSAAAATTAAEMEKGLAGINLDELKKDSAGIYETAQGILQGVQGDANTIATTTTIRPQREAFNSLSNNLLQFLNVVKYDREVLYWQECPMAFDDEISANWISKSGEDKDRRNPYLGLKDPKYGKGMLKCGETKLTINHSGGK